MKPVDKAIEFFGQEFDDIVAAYLECGFVYSGSDAFALAMPHSVDFLFEQNLNKELDKHDCWFVQYVSGDIKRLLELLDGLPLKFDWIVFERELDEDDRFSDKHRYKVYETKRLMEKFNGKRKHTKSPARASASG